MWYKLVTVFWCQFCPPKKLWFWETTTSCGQLRKKRVQQQQQPKFTQHITPIARLRVSCDASLVLTGEPAQSRRYHQTPPGHQPDTANTPLRHRRGTAVSTASRHERDSQTFEAIGPLKHQDTEAQPIHHRGATETPPDTANWETLETPLSLTLEWTLPRHHRSTTKDQDATNIPPRQRDTIEISRRDRVTETPPKQHWDATNHSKTTLPHGARPPIELTTPSYRYWEDECVLEDLGRYYIILYYAVYIYIHVYIYIYIRVYIYIPYKSGTIVFIVFRGRLLLELKDY